MEINNYGNASNKDHLAGKTEFMRGRSDLETYIYPSKFSRCNEALMAVHFVILLLI